MFLPSADDKSPWWVSLRWHAHLARDFTGGTPVPLLQTYPLPKSPVAVTLSLVYVPLSLC